MKIKNLFSMLAMAGMLFATSCSQDEAIGGAAAGDFVDATFTIGTADGMGTRAIGDGTTVDMVACAVYDAYNKEELPALRKYVPINGKTATYSVRLAKGKNYRVAFFAYNAAANAYDVTDLKNIVVKDGQLSNVEGRDAFTAYYDVEEGKTMNTFTEKVTLYRPFAQLNLGIDDTELEDAADAGLVISKSKIVVSNVYGAFSAYEDKVVGTTGEMTFGLNAIPTEKLKVTVDGVTKEYNYLALNYLLVGDNDSEKTLTDVDFVWESSNGDSNAESVTTFLNIPVQRNYRTNIVGKLLTSPTTFNIVIDDKFKGEKNDSRVFNAAELQAALDAAPAGKTTYISLGANIEGDVTEFQKNDRNVVIEGYGYKYDGTIKIHNGSTYCNGEFTIKDVNFETSTASLNFIEALENGSERYSQNVTVDGCTFTATGDAVNTAVGVQIKASKNAKVLNCTATNMHSLIQAQSCDESVTVKECTVNGKNGVAFKQVKNAVVEGNTINAVAYGIRFDGNTDNYAVTIKDNTVTAKQPFIVRRMTGANNTITLEGANTLTTSEAYQIVITNGEDDEAYSEPTGTYTLTGADNYSYYPEPATVASWDEFTAALAAGEKDIKLTDNITYAGNYSLQKNVNINLNGKSITMPMFYVFSTATIKNGTINGKMYARTGCKATLDGLTFSGEISDNLSTEGHLTVQGGCDVYAKNCVFEATTVSGTQTKSLTVEGRSSGALKFENCDFKFRSWGDGTAKYKKQVYLNPMSGTATVDFTNCKFNGKAPNIMFGATYALTNLTMSGCDNTAPTLEIQRAKTSVTDADWDYLKTLIANNNFTRVRIFYTDGNEYYSGN